ncbi:MAG: M15 family metallopeptidase, partial [Firmicutes bacterium]|nr:M15 family metallopeptidase [Bacillota bacterium]
IALPGHSEHNAGLAMDIVSDTYWSNHSDLDESFDQLPQYDWLIENSWKYGFILSYPKGKEDITGFIYEPWHYRFVGLEHAKKIHEIYESTGEFLTVNEYIEKYAN